MSIQSGEILETVKMVADQHFDVRTITIGIDLHDCISTDIDVLNQNIYNKITTVGKDLVATAKHLSAKYGVPIVNQRISVTPIAQIAAATKADSYVSVAQTLDKAAKAIGVSFIGGFSALVQKGMSPSDEVLIRSIPEAMKTTDIVCSSINIGSTRAGINMDAVRLAGETIKRTAEITPEGFGCAKIVVFCNAVEDNPFMAGAFCSNLPFIKQSRILTNFSGSLSDVVTIAHELGHAYHGLHIENHRVLNQEYSMPVAETASTFNENIVMNTVIKQASDAEKVALLESQLQDTTQIIVDIYSRYLFESAVFENREKSFMFSKDLEKLMLDAQKEAYGDGLDPDAMHPYMWACKPHYYSSGLSFYNFPYAFGGLFSKGLYAIYQEQPEGFVEKYQELLRATTVTSAEDTAKVLGVDVTDSAFWKKALAQVADNIEQFIALTPVKA